MHLTTCLSSDNQHDSELTTKHMRGNIILSIWWTMVDGSRWAYFSLNEFVIHAMYFSQYQIYVNRLNDWMSNSSDINMWCYRNRNRKVPIHLVLRSWSSFDFTCYFFRTVWQPVFLQVQMLLMLKILSVTGEEQKAISERPSFSFI